MSRRFTILQAIHEALDQKLADDRRVMLTGEDIGVNGGVFRATEGLFDKYGKERVVDTPLAEAGIIGSAIGLALNGFIPVVEIQFLAFIYPGFEQLITHAARMRYRTRGQYNVPLVIRTPYGAGIRGPELHSESVEAFFVHTPGLKVVVPSNPYDAKGLLISAIEDPDPVVFLEPARIYRAFKEEVPEEMYRIPLGKANIVQEGTDVTLISWGAMMRVALEAARQLEQEKGWSCEVIDLRSLYPLDRDAIAASVKKTGRALIVHEAQKTAGVGAEIVSLINDEALMYLRAPIQRITGFDVPVPQFSLEDVYVPTVERVRAGIATAIQF
ncbi:alpha-ketoacid dehydrogenase subunit beta [Paenibacillus thiaminolyticus]|uniref:Alpha-ketoacid dehydrogenase subunit beta n=1 Tax=Paenibacillus thiaminolyticus TaxID=49283 RepID=A0AAP9DXN9_PANTH|nr:alpha-ketoacid dehydrogenase subunit beta [Paenibacillus thiaminolyticus]MCY9535212.1 alpha-ketoacid dehydrogenase subunit beta [Paenibacillus thiaminolyticus]MCY9602473.1 alpha-ketoacid dehydrogenase subunit beta [Paenibacillus thiaminolyticus]MCY9606125.1 alpha-ketoacid dehydrogenase subunit beta [Paenibacillus thiaminolyticus]MCY9612510.1 alpha-ketoacid dehydrogenase subunit beta [Paenibacillus thiaminolyticus]MCY9620861.1 alpha-ketoacid dehydrogenase subunit beta [Paenibacillus thiamino